MQGAGPDRYGDGCGVHDVSAEAFCAGFHSRFRGSALYAAVRGRLLQEHLAWPMAPAPFDGGERQQATDLTNTSQARHTSASCTDPTNCSCPDATRSRKNGRVVTVGDLAEGHPHDGRHTELTAPPTACRRPVMADPDAHPSALSCLLSAHRDQIQDWSRPLLPGRRLPRLLLSLATPVAVRFVFCAGSGEG
jgi:hypothetical protein